MNRGSIVVVSGASGIGSKPRPALIVQNDLWLGTMTILIAPFTSDVPGDMVVRPIFEPSLQNGLRETSALMIDKITPAKRTDIGSVIGQMSETAMNEVDAALRMIFKII